jgi:serine/threonine protein kinase
MEWRNSRESGKGFDRLEEYRTDTDNFKKNSRASTLLFTSVIGMSTKEITLNDFEIICVLGKGSFGKVILSKFKENGEYYAIKAIRKDVLIESDQVEATKNERDILVNVKH